MFRRHATLRPLLTFTIMLGCFLALGCQIRPAHAAVHPGFRSLGIWDETTGARLDIAVWYPVSRAPASVTYGDWTLKVNRRAQPLPGPFPLIVISHGTAGNRFAHHTLARDLVNQGYMVAAPTHQGDNLQDMELLFTAGQLVRRLHEIRLTLEALDGDPVLAGHVDPQRTALVGFGSGGTTALLAAGARVSRQAWGSWKAAADEDAPYKNPWAGKRLDGIVESLPLQRMLAEPRIRCVVAAAPAHSMFFDADSLAAIRIPVLLLGAEKDPVNPLSLLERLAQALPDPAANVVVLTGARPLDLMARPDAAVSFLPGYAPPGPRQHAAINAQVSKEIVRFLQDTVGDPALPPIDWNASPDSLTMDAEAP